jgi:glycosyltransferase involved in cell wall biosynthesis
VRPLSRSGELIACCGERWDDRCLETVEAISRNRSCPPCRLAMAEWLADDELARASLFWVVGAGIPPQGLLSALQVGIPVLVPAECHELKQICVEGECGLYYDTAAEAAESIFWFLNDEGMRKQLGRNGRAYCESLSRETAS